MKASFWQAMPALIQSAAQRCVPMFQVLAVPFSQLMFPPAAPSAAIVTELTTLPAWLTRLPATSSVVLLMIGTDFNSGSRTTVGLTCLIDPPRSVSTPTRELPVASIAPAIFTRPASQPSAFVSIVLINAFRVASDEKLQKHSA